MLLLIIESLQYPALYYFQQIQDVVAICSYDTAGSFLLLGCENGSIYYIGKTILSRLTSHKKLNRTCIN